MEGRDLTTFLSYHCLTGPLMNHPVTEMDEIVTKLRLKYRTYIVEYDPEDGAVKLPNMFVADFEDKINRLVKLVDGKKNKFEVLVDRIAGSFFLTKGWKAISDFYRLGLCAWVTFVFVASGRFEMVVKDRFGKAIRCPYFDPPMRFVIDMSDVSPVFDNDLPPVTYALSYRHSFINFQIDFVKKLTESDVNKGFLKLRYEGQCEQIFHRAFTTVNMVDDCGNIWECVMTYGSIPYEHIKIGGGWKRFVQARNIDEGVMLRIGGPMAGRNHTIYVTVIAN